MSDPELLRLTNELGKRLHCLYLEVAPSIADDIWNAFIVLRDYTLRERDTRAAVPPSADRVLARVRSIAACGNQPPCSVCNAQIFAIAADLEAIAASVPQTETIKHHDD